MSISIRISLLLATITLLVGLSSAYLGGRLVEQSLRGEMAERGQYIASTLAEAYTESVLNKNLLPVIDGIKKIVMDRDDISYIYFTDVDGSLVAHSFVDGFPLELLSIWEQLPPGADTRLIVSSGDSEKILELRRSLVEGLHGYIHVGLSISGISKNVVSLQQQIMFTTLLITMAAILLGIFSGYRMTMPLKKLALMMEQFGKGESPPRQVAFDSGGREVKELSATFQQMLQEREASDALLNESEKRYRLAVDSTNDGLWDWDVTSGTVSYSPGWARIVGEQSIENSYEAWERRIHPHDRERVLGTLRKHLAGETDRWSQEHRLSTFAGDWKWVLGRGRVVERDADGRPLRMIGTMTDIDERKYMELEKERLQMQLNQSQKMETIGQLTGGIAHEFNNLLGAINGFAHLGMTQAGEGNYEKLPQYLERITESGERAASLVKQMLVFSRQDQVESAPVRVPELLVDTIRLIRATIPSTIEIETSIDSDLPCVLLNTAQFEQVLMNLAVNARDAMNGVGSLKIGLGWARELDTHSNVTHRPIRGDWIELSVKDSGSGISPELIGRIFDPFFTTKEVGKGTGMGLSVVMRIIEEFGGHIIVDSEPAQGTEFRLLFPPVLEEETHTQPVAVEEEVAITRGDGVEVLVVDDEPMLVEQLSELVGQEGYTACGVSDSGKALELFKQEPARFSLIITDQTMPGMSGLELISNLRDVRPGLPAILCSGYSDKIDAEGASALGITYLPKPISFERLLREMSMALGRAQ